MLQKLIDEGVVMVLDEYDRDHVVTTRAVAILTDGARREVPFDFSGGLSDLDQAFESADQALGDRDGLVIIYLFTQGSEVVIISGRSGGKRAMSMLHLTRDAGDASDDFKVITGVVVHGIETCEFCKPTDWFGGTTTISCMITEAPIIERLM